MSPTSPTHDEVVARLRRGDSAIGTMLRLVRHPAVTAIAREAGLDMVMLDMEHGAHAIEHLEAMALAGHGEGLAVMVRVPELARGYVSRALDAGADGVMVPMLETPEQARRLVQWAKFPPLGRRGLGSIGGHTGFRKPDAAPSFIREADQCTLAIAQIETTTGVEHIDAIAATDGIDALVVGPNDLAVSLGVPGELTAPPVDEAIARIADAAARHGRIFGMHAGTDMLGRWIDRNMTLLLNSMDINVLGAGFASLREQTEALGHKRAVRS